MAETRNYLLGYGERLTERISMGGRPMNKVHPYQFSEAQASLAPLLQATSEQIDRLPEMACPRGEVVASVTLHPAYIAKTFFPTGLLRQAGVEAIGSKPVTITPRKVAERSVTKAGVTAARKPPAPAATAELFVVGTKDTFRDWAKNIRQWTGSSENELELRQIETIRLPTSRERLKPMRSDATVPLLEVVLHSNEDHVVEGFREYMRSLDVSVNLDARIEVQHLCFLPVRARREVHLQMAQFGFLRVAREMPRLRDLTPGVPSATRSHSTGFTVNLPSGEPMNKDLRVAIFDGGVESGIIPPAYLAAKKAHGVGPLADKSHGTGVTSALLFGHLEEGVIPPIPYAAVEHFRVLDAATMTDPQGHYFELLNRITSILSQRSFDFVNLSLGPDLPIEDDEVHVWTAALDELFSGGQTLVTVAAGNSGGNDWDSGNARIQAPSDGVNVLAVGACDKVSNDWKRAGYSSIGPGRSPGIVKPDVLTFGGSDGHLFQVLDSAKAGRSIGVKGTSFSSPLALRTAIGIRTHLGSAVKALGVKALMIHHSDPLQHDTREVGWGRVSHSVEDLVLCEDGQVHVLYQGILEPGKYLRARIPVPADLSGMVTIAATFCYATPTDPQDPMNYTRAGLDVTFRPHMGKLRETPKGRSKNPVTKSFFQSDGYLTEEELRRDAHKWESCRKAESRLRASSLVNPVFDIHYNARRGGMGDQSAPSIPYALVVTIKNDSRDLYNRTFNRYRTHLEPLRPVIQLPIRTRR